MPDRPRGLTSREAPPGLTLPVPLHVRIASLGLGVATGLLGLLYLTAPPRTHGPGPLSSTVLSLLEQPLGWCMVLLGAWVIVAAVSGVARSSAHGVAAIAHLAYTAALVQSFLALVPPRPSVVSILSVFAFVAHGGACLDYWKRGWR